MKITLNVTFYFKYGIIYFITHFTEGISLIVMNLKLPQGKLHSVIGTSKLDIMIPSKLTYMQMTYPHYKAI